MKLATYLDAGSRRLALVAGDTLVDPLLALAGTDPARPHFTDAIAFIRGGAEARRAADHLVAQAPATARRPLSGTVLAAPMLPTTILCSGSNYRDHNQEKANTPISGREPEFFIKTSDCVIGPGEPIVLDEKVTRKMDCETELAIVIGKPGRHIPVASALDHVFGYTIVNDVTARDRQVRRNDQGMVWYELGRGKCFDSSAPLGPVIVTADEVGDPQRLALKTRINGELRQSSTTGQMIWSCAELIHFFSVNFTLRPGMVIITGTPAGTAWSQDRELGGSGKSPPGVVPATGYCAPGDVVECELERVGILRNPVVAA
jgi:2-keto-4-pentenoate hydratase/2-oxohepta-3-ene-1,7-dioic acid hydratase in catechol pathway